MARTPDARIPATRTPNATGAVPVRDGEKRRRPAWLLPLLALLALLAEIALIVALSSGGDDKTKGTSAPSGQSAAAQLTAGGTQLRPNGLNASVGEQATGRNLVVQAVVPNEGFWVGTSATDRL